MFEYSYYYTCTNKYSYKYTIINIFVNIYILNELRKLF